MNNGMFWGMVLPVAAALVHPVRPAAADNPGSRYFAPAEPSPVYVFLKAAYECIEDARRPALVTRTIKKENTEYCYREWHDLGAGTGAVRYTLTAPVENGIVWAEFHVRLPACDNYPQEQAHECVRVQKTWKRPAILERLEEALAEAASIARAGVYSFFADIDCQVTQTYSTSVNTYPCRPTAEEPRRSVTYLTTFIADFDADEEPEEMSLYAENTGGSGTFYYAVVKEADGTVSVRVQLGDRIKFRQAALTGDRQALRVEYIGHGAKDPLCCPTVPQTVRITYRNNQLTVSE